MISRRNFILLTGLSAGSLTMYATPTGTPPAGCLCIAPPTGQRVLDGSVLEGVFMDTGTGNPRSGMFGNVRRYADGSPRFHEGIDIAPLQPWRRNTAPTDTVRAAADGLIVYLNRCDRNESLYGNYAVLTHDVPDFGPVYTLYAHLNRFDTAVRAGQTVRAGQPLGVLGHTPDIPLGRSHLHFEFGIMLNRFYPLIDPQHGVWNGANLLGIDPCLVFAEQRRKGYVDVAALFRSLPPAMTVALPATVLNRLDILKRHPRLRPVGTGSHLAVTFSCEGIPTAVRAFTPDRPTPFGALLSHDPAEIRRGRPFVAGGRLTERGRTLLVNLLAAPGHIPEDGALSEIA